MFSCSRISDWLGESGNGADGDALFYSARFLLFAFTGRVCVRGVMASIWNEIMEREKPIR